MRFTNSVLMAMRMSGLGRVIFFGTRTITESIKKDGQCTSNMSVGSVVASVKTRNHVIYVTACRHTSKVKLKKVYKVYLLNYN
jgi:riboflavin synthase